MMHIDITSPPHECFLQNFLSSPSIMIFFCLLSIFSSIFSFKYSLPQFSSGVRGPYWQLYTFTGLSVSLSMPCTMHDPQNTHTHKIPHGSFIVNRWKHVMLENLLTSPKYELGMKEATLMGTFLFQKAHKAR